MLLFRLIAACQSTAVGPSVASQKEQLLVQIWIQANTVTAPEQQQRVSAFSPGNVPRRTQRKNLLRISDCDQGSDPCWQSDPVQLTSRRLLVRTNAQSGFRAGHPWPARRV